MSEPNTAHPRIADREQWLAERKTLLAATRQLDTVRAKTCSIPARPHPVQPARRLEDSPAGWPLRPLRPTYG